MSDILMIHPTNWYSFHHEIHQDFHHQISSLYTIQETKTISESLKALESPTKPKVVLLVNGEICEKEYSNLIKKVSSYAKEGGTVIMCFQFASSLVPTSSKVIFQKDLGLTWKLGTYIRQDFTLNSMFKNVFKTTLDLTYNVKALHISRVSENSQIYMVNDGMNRESPVIFERYTDTGFIGYIGDVNNEAGSQAILLAMLDKAINNTQRTHLEPNNINTSPDTASGQSISDRIQPDAPTTQSTEPSSSKPKKKNKKKKSKAQKAQSGSDPQVNGSQPTTFDEKSSGSSLNEVDENGTHDGLRPRDAQSEQQNNLEHDLPQPDASSDPPSNLSNEPMFCSHIDLSTMAISTFNTHVPDSQPLGENSVKPKKCSFCHQAGHHLQRCGKCKVVEYCSKECQRSAWATHQKSCEERKQSTKPSSSSSSSEAKIPTTSMEIFQLMYGNRLNLFENQSKLEIYRRIIDLYRLRCDDEFRWEGKRVGLYKGENGLPLLDFQTYLNKAEKSLGFLPTWWNLISKKECIQIASDENGKSFIGIKMTKADIQKAYNDNQMPLMMRLNGEKIFGSRIGG